MTYIAAFHCREGIVMCADTQETIEDGKNYAEKLEAVEAPMSYPLAIGGAGADTIIKPMVQEITERVNSEKPNNKEALKKLLTSCVKEVFKNDVPLLALKQQHRAPQFVVAAKPPNDEFCIFPIEGRRVYEEQRKVIIGFPSAYNYALLNRMYRDGLSMQQAVMLATYLVSQSKKFDEGVGGETRVAVVTQFGARIDDPEYIKNSEIRVSDFLLLIDNLFLFSVDVSIRPSLFAKRAQEFIAQLHQFRERYLHYSAERSLNRQLFDKEFRGEPYPKVFPGAIFDVDERRNVTVREESPEEITERFKLYELAVTKMDRNREATEKFQKFNMRRHVAYTGRELVELKPWRSADEAKDTTVCTSSMQGESGQQS